MSKSLLLVLLGFGAAAATLVGIATHRPSQSLNAPESTPVAQQQDEELLRIRTAVETALSSKPPGGYSPIPRGVRLLSITRSSTESIVLDFSKELLADGTGPALEDAVHQILTAAWVAPRSATAPVAGYEILVNGVPLESYLR